MCKTSILHVRIGQQYTGDLDHVRTVNQQALHVLELANLLPSPPLSSIHRAMLIFTDYLLATF